jgi:sulfur carrier protein
MSEAMDDTHVKRTFTVNGAPRPWSGQSLRALLADSGVAPDRGGVAVARNGAVVPRADWDSTAVQPDDRIEIVHIVRGG